MDKKKKTNKASKLRLFNQGQACIEMGGELFDVTMGAWGEIFQTRMNYFY